MQKIAILLWVACFMFFFHLHSLSQPTPQEQEKEQQIRKYEYMLLFSHLNAAEKAKIHVELGFLYLRKSSASDKDIEKAIRHFQQSMLFFTRTQDEQIWAILQASLGDAYSKLQNNQAKNIELAIQCYQQALKVYTKEICPEPWAETNISLANAYRNRTKGEKAKNIELEIHCYQKVLEVYTQDARPQEWAGIHGNLGNAYRNRIQGNPSENIELAILHYNKALAVYTQDQNTQSWAAIQMSLGSAYQDRIQGNPSENIELAILYYNKALEVFSREKGDVEWAFINKNLGNAYRDRTLGNKLENIEQAIRHYQQALEVFTKEAHQEDWAFTQMNLGSRYCNRMKGNKAQNIEQAIQHYQQALEVFTKEAHQEDWALTQMNLGNAYHNRVQGNKAQNIEQAIQHYQQALEVSTKEAHQEDWALTQMNLGNAYSKRIQGNETENSQLTIQCYQKALEVFTKQRFPDTWAVTMINLGSAYSHVSNNQAENIELAIQHCQQALQLLDRGIFPQDWATANLNLGNAYLKRIQGNKTDNIEQAISYYQQALEIFSKDTFPEYWAITYINLGVAYRNRIQGDKSANIAMAIQYYQKAFEVYTKEIFPLEYIDLCNNIANAYVAQENWQAVCKICEQAEQVMERYLTLCITQEEQEKALTKIQKIITWHSMALAKSGNCMEAWAIQEKIKARFLSQSLWLRQMQNLPIDIKLKQEIEQLRQEIVNLQYQLRPTASISMISSDADNQPQILAARQQQYLDTVQQIQEKQKQLQEKIAFVQQQASMPLWQDWKPDSILQQTRTSKIAVVSIQINDTGTFILVSCPKDAQIRSLWISEFTSDQLANLTDQWIGILRKFEEYETKNLPGKEANRDEFCIQQSKILAEIGQAIWPELDALLQEQKTEKVLLIPSNLFYLYPLHATPFIPKSTEKETSTPIYPVERYTIAYTPSLRLYDQLCHAQKAEQFTRHVLFAENPDGSLGRSYFAEQKKLQAQIEAKNFSLTFLKESQINPEKLLEEIPNSFVFHYYGHGYYDWNDPDQSGLLLGNKQALALRQIKISLAQKPIYLVSLGACETGILSIEYHQREQYEGLPAGFLNAGAQCVVASQWPVLQDATCELFRLFYEELFSGQPGMCPALAMRHAQIKMLRQGKQTWQGLTQIKEINLEEWKATPSSPSNPTAPSTANTTFAPIPPTDTILTPATSNGTQAATTTTPITASSLDSLPTLDNARPPLDKMMPPSFWAAFYTSGNAFSEVPHHHSP